MDMVVIQPYILVSKLKKIKTKFIRCTGYLNSIKNPINILKRYLRDPVKTYFGILKIQVKF